MKLYWFPARAVGSFPTVISLLEGAGSMNGDGAGHPGKPIKL